MTKFDYSNLARRRTTARGQREASSDSEARASIRRVLRNRPTALELHRTAELARDVVINYDPASSVLSECDSAYILDLQTKHGGDSDWLPSKWVASAVLTIVRFGEHEEVA
jgi:hypothetical protein